MTSTASEISEVVTIGSHALDQVTAMLRSNDSLSSRLAERYHKLLYDLPSALRVSLSESEKQSLLILLRCYAQLFDHSATTGYFLLLHVRSCRNCLM